MRIEFSGQLNPPNQTLASVLDWAAVLGRSCDVRCGGRSHPHNFIVHVL